MEDICRKGKHGARTIMRCRVLLAIDRGIEDKDICVMEGLGRTTPFDIRKRYAEGGLERAIYDAPRPGQPRRLEDKECTQVLAIACSKPPDGRECWTLDLITERVKQEIGKEVGRSTVSRVLLSNNIKPWQKKNVVCT